MIRDGALFRGLSERAGGLDAEVGFTVICPHSQSQDEGLHGCGRVGVEAKRTEP